MDSKTTFSTPSSPSVLQNMGQQARVLYHRLAGFGSRKRIRSSSKCSLVFYHRDHKERREVADLRLICRFFVFSAFFAVECVL
ncbi:MAG: hypothetical protein WAV70_07210, partial [Anaerolineae bacterium]